MKHPNAEEWMEYLYGEMPRSSAALLREHLKSCGPCQEQYGSWQRAKKRLGAWRLDSPAADSSSRPWAHIEKWAIAALLVLGIGFGIGRLSAPRPNLAEWRAELEPSLRASLLDEMKQQVRAELSGDLQAAVADSPGALATPFRRQLRASLNQWSDKMRAASGAESQRLFLDFAEGYWADRQEEQRAMLTLLDRTNQKYQAEHVSLRRALETVAVVADDKFARTETQLGQLASYAQAKLNLEPTDK